MTTSLGRWTSRGETFMYRAPGGSGAAVASVRSAVRAGPGPDAADPLDRDVRDVARWRIVHPRELHVGPEVGVRQPLEQLGGAAFGDAGQAVDDHVFIQAHLVARAGLNGQGHPRVAAHVADLAVLGQVRGDDL